MADLRVKSRGMVQDSAKLLLRNVIRHTDTHNRLAEETEMWNVYRKIQGRSQDDEGNRSDTGSSGRKRKRDRDRHQSDRSFRDPDVKNSFLYDDRQVVRGHNSTGRHSKGRAHMDFYDSDTDRSTDMPPSGKSTYWMRQLEKTEAADEDRWGHAGYRELYPHDFKSDRSGSDSSSQEDSDDDSNNRRKKKRKSHSSSSDKRRLKKKKEKKKKAEKKKQNSDDWRECDAIKRKLKKKRKRHAGEDDSDDDKKQMKRSKKDNKESHRKKRRK